MHSFGKEDVAETKEKVGGVKDEPGIPSFIGGIADPDICSATLTSAKT